MPAEQAPGALTDREREVLDLMARGLTNGQIAEHLDIGFETAKTHVSRVIAKTGANTREEAVANWQAANRPVAKVRRKLRGWWGVPAIRVGSGIAGVVAVAALGLGVWYEANDDEAGGTDPIVRYVEFEPNTRGTEDLVSFSEAIARQEEAIGAPAPVPPYLGDFGLQPYAVTTRLPWSEVTARTGADIVSWAVWYGDGPDEDSSVLKIGVMREEMMVGGELLKRTDCPPPSFADGWTMVETADGFEVAHWGSPDRGGLASYQSVSSCFRTQLRVVGSSNLPQDEALAILESVLKQE